MQKNQLKNLQSSLKYGKNWHQSRMNKQLNKKVNHAFVFVPCLGFASKIAFHIIKQNDPIQIMQRSAEQKCKTLTPLYSSFFRSLQWQQAMQPQKSSMYTTWNITCNIQHSYWNCILQISLVFNTRIQYIISLNIYVKPLNRTTYVAVSNSNSPIHLA